VRPAALAAVLAALVLPGCASLPAAIDETTLDTGTAVRLGGVPFFPDESYYCGPATLAALLTWSGAPSTPAELSDELIIPERQGTLAPEMLGAARRAGRLAFKLQPTMAAIERELAAGHPVVALQNLAFNWWPRWHYAVVTGSLPDSDTVILNTGVRQARPVDATVFDRTWARSGRWAAVVTAPGQLPATADADRLFTAIANLENAAGAEASMPYWRTAAARWPHDGRYVVGKANAEYALGHHDTALATLEAASDDVDNDRDVVLNNLASLLAEKGRLERAEVTAYQALYLTKEHVPAIRETLADIRCRRTPDCTLPKSARE